MTVPPDPQEDSTALNQRLGLPLPELVLELSAVIGKKLIAYLSNESSTRAIDGWIAGAQPKSDVERRLRLSYEVVMCLRLIDSPEVVQAWLMGVNPDLGDRSALRMLREDSPDVAGPLLLAAAKAYLSSN
jgi:hypothetical protein